MRKVGGKIKAKIKVCVLYGGPGSEREVSINSGKNVVAALKSGENSVRYAVSSLAFRDPGELLKKLKSVKPDVIFPIVHGTFGEDGTLQALLEVFGKPYVGSGVLASALCMDKIISGELLFAKGLNIPKHLGVRPFSYPCVVKPRSSGSSVGVSIVRKKGELAKAIKLASKEGAPIFQEFIAGTEVTCCVLDLTKAKPSRRFSLRALPVTEIVPKSKFFDYKAKYTKGGSDEITPARISLSLTKAVQEAALLAHKTLSCRHISRSDFILAKGKLYYLETNTAPGMTDTSLVPQAATVAGISMSELCHRLVQSALVQ